jgi:hypothetical protein
VITELAQVVGHVMGVMAATIGGLFPLDAGWMELRDIHYLASASVHDI